MNLLSVILELWTGVTGTSERCYAWWIPNSRRKLLLMGTMCTVQCHLPCWRATISWEWATEFWRQVCCAITKRRANCRPRSYYCPMREPENFEGRFAVQLQKDRQTVGHIPQEMSKLCWLFIHRGSLTAENNLHFKEATTYSSRRLGNTRGSNVM